MDIKSQFHILTLLTILALREGRFLGDAQLDMSLYGLSDQRQTIIRRHIFSAFGKMCIYMYGDYTWLQDGRNPMDQNY